MDLSLLKDSQTRRWTRSEYYAMADMGWFEGQRVELIEGKIVVMSPQNSFHGRTFRRVARKLEAAFGSGFWVQTQTEINLSENSAPEPDVSVIAGNEDEFRDHPTTAVLVVEVSGSTLRTDRSKKAALYAKYGILDYWIMNLFEQQIEIRRNPGQNAQGDWVYNTVEIFKAGATVSPLAKPDVLLRVSELFPPND